MRAEKAIKDQIAILDLSLLSRKERKMNLWMAGQEDSNAYQHNEREIALLAEERRALLWVLNQ